MAGEDMATTELFALALGLTAPWQVKDITFDAEAHRLDQDIDLNFFFQARLPMASARA